MDVKYLSDEDVLGLSDSESLALIDIGDATPLITGDVLVQTGTYDITGAGATVLSTRLAGYPALARVRLAVDGLDTAVTGDTYSIVIKVNGRVCQPSPTVRDVADGDTDVIFRTGVFFVVDPDPNGASESADPTVEVVLISPKAGDTAVDVEARLLLLDTDAPGTLLTLMFATKGGLLDTGNASTGSISAGTGGGSIGPGGGGGGGGGGGTTPGNVDFWGYDMALTQVANNSGTVNATSFVQLLSATPDASNTTVVVFKAGLGDGSGSSGDLDGSGGAFLFRVKVAGRTQQPSPISVTFDTATESCVDIGPFIVPANEAISLEVDSPNADSAIAQDTRLIVLDTLTEAGVAGAVWDEPKSSHTTPDTFGDYLDDEVTSRASPTDVLTQLGVYDGPTNTEMVAAFTEIKGATWSSVTDTLEEIRDAIDNIEFGASPGAISHTVTVTDDDTEETLSGIAVWVTNGSDSSQAIQNGVTDAQGQYTFYLQAGTYNLWKADTARPGRNFSNPTSITVSE